MVLAAMKSTKFRDVVAATSHNGHAVMTEAAVIASDPACGVTAAVDGSEGRLSPAVPAADGECAEDNSELQADGAGAAGAARSVSPMPVGSTRTVRSRAWRAAAPPLPR